MLADSALRKVSRINTFASAESKQLEPDENVQFQTYSSNVNKNDDSY